MTLHPQRGAGYESTRDGRRKYDYGMAVFDDSEILPPPPAGAVVLHDREYRVRSFLLEGTGPTGERRMLIQGALRDQKPTGMMVVGETEPLTIHHMQVEIEVAYPSLEIVAARVVFEEHPHLECVSITDHYQGLVGLSIARGFTHKVRELFGGPRGCTHTTALLVAMAPVAIQTRWSVSSVDNGPVSTLGPDEHPVRSRGELDGLVASSMNTCHVWAEDGPAVPVIRAGGTFDEPITLTRRRRELDASR